MKTIVVLSDTHGNRADLQKLDGVFSECDYIFHLGDTSGDGAWIYRKYPNKTFLINGNCDAVQLGDNELDTEIEGVKIFATHGHLYSVKSTRIKLAAKAALLGCKIALYGHTHVPDESIIDGVTVINPGTLSRYGNKSYSYIVIHQGKFTHKCVPLN